MDLVKYDGNSTKYFMKLRTEQLEGKDIVIYDDIFEGGEILQFMRFFYDLGYTPKRTASSFDKTTPTLKCDLQPKDMLNLGWLNNNTIKELIVNNNLRMHQSYVNLTTASDIHEYHIDANAPGCLTCLYYGNPEWKGIWEGETHFTDSDLDDVKLSVGFKPGRTVFFDGRIPHKTSNPSHTATDYRYVLVVKFTSNEYPGNHTNFPIKDFYLNNEFDITEKEKRAIEELKPLVKGITHAGGVAFFDHLYNTFSRLKTFGCDEDVCLAGLYHSIFGTETFQFDSIVDENRIKDIIGEYAFDLVKIFCSDNKRESIFSQNGKTKLDLLKIEYANLIDQYMYYEDENDTIQVITEIKNEIENMEQEN